jgi:DNA-binding MurR/RpiR family transcriptional regulator
MATANQLKATITREKPHTNHFIKINEESIAEAIKDLTPAQFQVWLYLAKNKDGIIWEISPRSAENCWGISESTFHKAITALKTKGYLVAKEKQPNKKSKTEYIFYEKP